MINWLLVVISSEGLTHLLVVTVRGSRRAEEQQFQGVAGTTTTTSTAGTPGPAARSCCPTTITLPRTTILEGGAVAIKPLLL